MSGKLPKRNWKDCQHNAFAPSATERDRKLGCLMSTQPDNCCYRHLEQVESGTPLLWANRSSEALLITVRVHSRMVCYLLLVHLSSGQFHWWAGGLFVLSCWQSTARVNSPEWPNLVLLRPVWSHKKWCNCCWKEFIFSGSDFTSFPNMSISQKKYCSLCRCIRHPDVLSICCETPISAEEPLGQQNDSYDTRQTACDPWTLLSLCGCLTLHFFSAAHRQWVPVQLFGPDTQPWTLLPSNPLRVLSHIQMSSWSTDSSQLSCGGVSNTHVCT